MKRFLPFLLCSALWAQGQLGFNIRHDPKSLHPLLAAEDAAEAVRYLTSGVLLRLNRVTQKVEPELADSWKVSPDHRSITFHLRQGVVFSDGTPFTGQDVVFTMKQATDPALHSVVGEAFVGGGAMQGSIPSRDTVTLTFAQPLAPLEQLFDQLPLLSASSPLKEKAVLGPFVMASYQPGVDMTLKRNPHYWKKDAAGKPLPYLDSIHLFIQGNREIEFTRFRRGEIHLINQMEPELYGRLKQEKPTEAHDLGPSTDVDFLWFNLVPAAPLPDWKKTWFQSINFRKAISAAINREDLCRVVYHGLARPALGLFSPGNQFWFDQKLKQQRFDPDAALKMLAPEGFSRKNGVLTDRQGHPVEFSLVTNTGNKSRERMAALIQQDLQTIGVKLNVVTLDFPSLLERITKNFNYEACLSGYTNLDLDPNGIMNVLLSSSDQHGWHPSQKTPATPWEAEIDRLMHAQASASDLKKRKLLFDQVQELMEQQSPYLFLVNRDALTAISPAVHGARPAALPPQTFWNVEYLSLK